MYSQSGLEVLMSKGSQATGSKDEAPKVDVMKVEKAMRGRSGSSKDTAKRLMGAADKTPLPDDEEDDEAVSKIIDSYSKSQGKVEVIVNLIMVRPLEKPRQDQEKQPMMMKIFQDL